ncbi:MULTISPECIES: YueI family protein [Pontibacillus]|uniref:YueI family protein n=1 Tax=Pontibacillus chungwhensis TaxID=265426 RepID=A0ABY8UZJ2_9BACI|nr:MULTISPECIES: YueI family protein [Pontibacillus]MCD5323971.1 YueI family protein [Pontibacillus sp. HN14]WIF97964.1 YueI family protein [Pontibacillus chungwhensis]
MSDKQVEDYLQNGIYGTPETKPGERKRYLGTIRERVVFALTKGQVMKGKGAIEMEEVMKNNPKAHLLLNGKISSRYYKAYRDSALKHGLEYTVINNREANSDLGAVLTYEHAVDVEEIFLQEEVTGTSPEVKGNMVKRFLNFLRRKP